MPIPTAQVLVALIAHISGPLMHLSHAVVNEPGPPMQVSIADHVGRVVSGQTVSYEVIVSNPSDSETPVMVRLTLSSSALTALKADDAAVIANAVAWKNLLNPGETRVYTVAGVVDSKVDVPDLAATACIHVDAASPALTCATDLDLVTKPTDRRWVIWAVAIALGLFAAAGSIWLQRKITPSLLTPSSSSSSSGDGAPR